MSIYYLLTLRYLSIFCVDLYRLYVAQDKTTPQLRYLCPPALSRLPRWTPHRLSRRREEMRGTMVVTSVVPEGSRRYRNDVLKSFNPFESLRAKRVGQDEWSSEAPPPRHGDHES